jgi:hypothetical protein
MANFMNTNNNTNGLPMLNNGVQELTLGVDAGVKYFMRSNLAIYASMGGDWNITGSGSNDGIAKQVDVGLKFYF